MPDKPEEDSKLIRDVNGHLQNARENLQTPEEKIITLVRKIADIAKTRLTDSLIVTINDKTKLIESPEYITINANQVEGLPSKASLRIMHTDLPGEVLLAQRLGIPEAEDVVIIAGLHSEEVTRAKVDAYTRATQAPFEPQCIFPIGDRNIKKAIALPIDFPDPRSDLLPIPRLGRVAKMGYGYSKHVESQLTREDKAQLELGLADILDRFERSKPIG